MVRRRWPDRGSGIVQSGGIRSCHRRYHANPIQAAGPISRMPMTARRLILALPLVLIGWISILAGVMRITGNAPAALVILPPADLLSHLPAGTAVVSIGPYSVTVKGGEGLVTALYDAGARLVLPAGLTGCLPQDAG
jgi:hypothetical protein